MRVVFRLLTPFVIVAVAAFGFTASAGAVNEFGDVQRGRWYAEPIDWLVGEGITNGTSEGCFSPYAQITRGQVVTFLYRLDQTRNDTEGPPTQQRRTATPSSMSCGPISSNRSAGRSQRPSPPARLRQRSL